MQATHPHFLLFSEGALHDGARPHWKFVLQSVGGEQRFAAEDTECETRATRLELLAVVRGLEALDQPSRVTLLTRSRYVRRGIRRGLNLWRERRWRWERFGNVVPIRDHDLWQRVDRALQYHQLDVGQAPPDTQPTTVGHNPPYLGAHPKNRHGSRRNPGWNIAAMLLSLRRSVLTPISSLWRPPFTRAA